MSQQTDFVREKYDKKAEKYDRMMAPLERMMMAKWRKQLLSKVEGVVLEAGVGTGANIPFYPPGVQVIAVDFSAKMLEIAKRKQTQAQVQVEFQLADIQELPFADNTFDNIVSACVFCTVPDPVKGFKELRRVIKPGGRLYFLEHVRSQGLILGPVMDGLNPIAVKLTGTNINRITEDNIRKSGMKIEQSENLFRDIVKLIIVDPNKA